MEGQICPKSEFFTLALRDGLGLCWLQPSPCQGDGRVCRRDSEPICPSIYLVFGLPWARHHPGSGDSEGPRPVGSAGAGDIHRSA